MLECNMSVEQLARKRANNKLFMAKKRAEDPQAKRDYEKAYRDKNRDSINAIARKCYDNNKSTFLKRSRINNLKKYGITQEQFDAMIIAQGSCCAICKTTEPGGKGTWKIDHCHSTKRVRGLLCHHCNSGLGYFKDNIKVIEAAIVYLERNI